MEREEHRIAPPGRETQWMDASLVVFTRQGHQKSINLKPGINIIGRRMDCDVRVPQINVSRKHCRLVHRDGKVLVQDLGSSNGTFVNSERVMEAEVKAGDRVSVGPVTFTVQIDGAPEHVEPSGALESSDSSSTGHDTVFQQVAHAEGSSETGDPGGSSIIDAIPDFDEVFDEDD